MLDKGMIVVDVSKHLPRKLLHLLQDLDLIKFLVVYVEFEIGLPLVIELLYLLLGLGHVQMDLHHTVFEP
jgi:hypothetical protein